MAFLVLPVGLGPSHLCYQIVYNLFDMLAFVAVSVRFQYSLYIFLTFSLFALAEWTLY